MSISRLKNQIQVHRKEGTFDSPLFQKWSEDVENCLIEEFGSDSLQLKQFRRLNFIGPLFFGDRERDYFQEALSQAETMLKVFEEELSESISWTGFWADIHPEIETVAKERYYKKNYADAVEAALKELNTKIKSIVLDRTGSEYDGADLMNRAFSVNQPIIKLQALRTETERNIQKGYQLIFSGAMTGIRNPKAHQNLKIDAKRARHLIYFVSFLAQTVDEEYLPEKLPD